MGQVWGAGAAGAAVGWGDAAGRHVTLSASDRRTEKPP